MKRPLPKVLAIAAVVAAGVWALRPLPWMQWLAAVEAQVAGLGPWGVVLFPFFYALCNILLLPGGTVVAASGGYFFGIAAGTFLILAGNLLGAAVALWLARTLGRRWLEPKIRNSPRWSRIDRAFRREGPKIIFLTQVHPFFPSSLLNYVYGTTSIPFGTCMLWIAAGQLPSCFFFACMGAFSQQGVDFLSGRAAETLPLVLKGISLLLTLCLTYYLGRMALRLMARSEEPEESLEEAPGRF